MQFWQRLRTNIMSKVQQEGACLIGTHDGKFHSDEAMACAMLTKYVKEFHNANIVRTRNPEVWATCNILVDVGGKYVPPYLLDHHQIDFQNTYPQYPVRLSSAGLVYLHYPEIIPALIDSILSKEKNLPFKPIIDQPTIEKMRDYIYKSLIQYLDAIDNGVDKVGGYEIGHVPTTLWGRVGALNPVWWEKDTSMEPFLKAVEICANELEAEAKNYLFRHVLPYGVVKEAFENRFTVNPSGKVVLLKTPAPWYHALRILEEEQNCVGNTLFMIYPDQNNGWRVQAVSVREGSFENRCSLKKEWRGVCDKSQLAQISGIPDIIFVHASGFIGGAISQENAIKMAVMSFSE